jgi:large subunit ribosomal protein L9
MESKVSKHLEVILRRKVENLGEIGDVVSVKPGFARNYLLPQGLAYPATEGSRRRLQQERAVALAVEERDRAAARALAERLEGVSITFTVLAGEEGKLYGSVGPRDIAAKLNEMGLDVHGRHVALKDTIKALGVYSVPIRLYPEIEPTVKVWVVREEGE